MEGVDYVPSLGANLFSVSNTTDNENELKFLSKYVSIFLYGKEISRGTHAPWSIKP